jgi:DNA-directed RNA polymerase alpha subunit
MINYLYCPGCNSKEHVRVERQGHIFTYTCYACAYYWSVHLTRIANPDGGETLDISISDLGLSARAYNILETEGIKTLRDLVQWSRKDLQRCRNCGKTTILEIEEALKHHMLMLQPEEK